MERVGLRGEGEGGERMSLLTELPTLGGADLRTQSTALWCATQGEGRAGEGRKMFALRVRKCVYSCL